MPATTPGGPLQLRVPIREFGDLRNTVRLTNFVAGFDLAVLQEAFGVLQQSPRYFDAQNIDCFSHDGQFQLLPKWNRIGALDGSDKQFLLVPFNAAIYLLPTANFVATDFQKVTQGTGTPSRSALANVYPGAVAVRGGVVWRNQLVVATGESVVRVMSTAEAWTTITAPGSVTGPIAGQVGTSQQDKLEVWWEGSVGAGLFEYNGSTWTQIFPPSGVTLPVMPTCDMIYDGPGSLLFATRDTTGLSALYEYLIQTTGTAFAIQIPATQGLRFWPQAAAMLGGATYLGGQLGNRQNTGPIYVKATAAAPDLLTVIDTNYGTDSQKGLDWSVRCMLNAGDILYFGSSSRYDHKFANYRLDQDQNGTEIIHPGSVGDLDGPVYSLAMLPSAVAGVSAGERLFASVPSGLYYRDAPDGADPTLDADTGFIQMPDIDIGSPDHVHIWAASLLALAKRATGSSVFVEYRVDPRKLSDPWLVLPAPIAGYVQGANKLRFPDDNKQQRRRGTAARVLQSRVRLTRATSGTDRDLIDSLAFRWARTMNLGATV